MIKDYYVPRRNQPGQRLLGEAQRSQLPPAVHLARRPAAASPRSAGSEVHPARQCAGIDDLFQLDRAHPAVRHRCGAHDAELCEPAGGQDRGQLHHESGVELLPDVRATLVEPGVVATELPNHITHADTKQGVQQLYDKAEVTAEDVAEIIAFILSRPRRLAINEILLRPAGQQ
jgi:hypothetical protein